MVPLLLILLLLCYLSISLLPHSSRQPIIILFVLSRCFPQSKVSEFFHLKPKYVHLHVKFKFKQIEQTRSPRQDTALQKRLQQSVFAKDHLKNTQHYWENVLCTDEDEVELFGKYTEHYV